MESTADSKTRLVWIFGIFRVFISEAIVFALLLFPIRNSSGEGTIMWTCLWISLVSILCALVFSKGIKQKVQIFYFTISIPVIVGLSYLMDIHWTVIIFLVLFTLWRLSTLMKEDFEDDFLDNKSGILLSTIIIGLVVYIIGSMYHLAQIHSILLLVLLQLFLFSFGTFVNRYLLSNQNHPLRIIIIGVCILLLPLTIVSVITLAFGVLRSGFLYFLNGFFSVIGFILTPFVRYFFEKGIDFFVPRINKKKDLINQILGEPEQNQNQAPTQQPDDLTFVYVAFSIILVCIAIWVIYKYKRFASRPAGSLINMDFISQTKLTEDWDEERLLTFNPNYSNPEHLVRKHVDALERFAIKRKLSRAPSESARDWMDRIGTQPTNHWLNIYENVRYGNLELSNQNLEYFMNETKKIKKDIKLISQTKNRESK